MEKRRGTLSCQEAEGSFEMSLEERNLESLAELHHMQRVKRREWVAGTRSGQWMRADCQYTFPKKKKKNRETKQVLGPANPVDTQDLQAGIYHLYRIPVFPTPPLN